MTSEAIPEIFGSNIKKIRQSEGITLDQFAKKARTFGAKWSAQRVAHIEGGKVTVSVQNLCIAAWALSGLSSRQVTPAQLLASESPVEVMPGFSVVGDAIPRVLEGGKLRARDVPSAANRITTAISRLTNDSDDFYMGLIGRVPDVSIKTSEDGVDDLDSVQADWDDPLYEDVVAEREGMGQSDERVAARLGVPMMQLLGMSFRLWGHSVSSEIAKRSEPGDSPQARGHITRQLEAELREVLDRGDD